MTLTRRRAHLITDCRSLIPIPDRTKLGLHALSRTTFRDDTMSLSTFLLGGSTAKKDKGKAIDKGLDDLFKTAVSYTRD